MMATEQLAQQFDERQVAIRGQVFWHGLLVAVGLLLVNAFLAVGNVAWASGFAQNLFMVLVTATVVATEAILRGAFFGRRQRGRVMAIMVTLIVGGFVIVAVHIVNALETVKLARTDHVVYTIVGMLVVFVGVAGLVRELADRRYRDEQA